VGLELTGRAYDRLVLTVDNSRDAVASFDSAAARTASITATQAANSSAATARIQMADRQSVAGREPLGQRPFKDPGRVDPAHVPGLIAADQPHAQGIGTPRPHHHHRGIAVGSGRQGMGAEHGMRVVVAPTDQAIEVRLARVPGQPGRADLRGRRLHRLHRLGHGPLPFLGCIRAPRASSPGSGGREASGLETALSGIVSHDHGRGKDTAGHLR
jgi:hypothetical protein